MYVGEGMIGDGVALAVGVLGVGDDGVMLLEDDGLGFGLFDVVFVGDGVGCGVRLTLLVII